MAFIMVRILCQLRSGKAQCFMKNFLKFGKWWDEKNLKTQCWNSKKCRTKIIISKKNPPFPTTTAIADHFHCSEIGKSKKKPPRIRKQPTNIDWFFKVKDFCDDGECWAAKTTPKKSIFLFLLQQWVFFEGWNVSKLLIFFNIFFFVLFLELNHQLLGTLDDTVIIGISFFLMLNLEIHRVCPKPKTALGLEKPPGHHFLRP